MSILRSLMIGIGFIIWLLVGEFMRRNGYFASTNILVRLSPDTLVTGGTIVLSVYILMGLVMFVAALRAVVRDLIRKASY